VAAALEKSKQSAAATVETVRENIKYLRISAPFDGVVTERDAHPGTLASPGRDRLLRIEQISRLRLVVPVPETEAGGIVRGGAVMFTVPAYPGQQFRGAISRVAHSIDLKSRTMAVEADVANAGGKLAPGMYAQVNWPVRQSRRALLVPATAVVTTTEKTFVVRVSSGRAEWVDVRKGNAAGELIEVMSPDLREGDVLVRRASDEIRDGSSLRAK